MFDVTARQSLSSVFVAETPHTEFVLSTNLRCIQKVILKYGLLDDANVSGVLTSALVGRRALMVVDRDFSEQNEAKLHLLAGRLAQDCVIVTRTFSEARKSLDAACELIEEFERYSLARRDVVIAIGGGVCCDVASFAASIYRRGVAHFKVPTTLLGIVDAGIGSKNAVNRGGAKNRIGTFYPPELSLLDPSLARTQPYEDFRCGLSEMLKVAMTSSGDLFKLMEELAGCSSTPEEIIAAFTQRRPIEIAVRSLLEELSVDLYEVGSLRRPADFGHSFSPDLEARLNGALAHGDAVAFEMIVLTEIAYARRLIDRDYLERVYGIYRSLRLPMMVRGISAETIWHGLLKTIQHRGGHLNMPMPYSDPGSCIIIDELGELTPNAFSEALVCINNRMPPDQFFNSERSQEILTAR